jgi:hypothetical protein
VLGAADVDSSTKCKRFSICFGGRRAQGLGSAAAAAAATLACAPLLLLLLLPKLHPAPWDQPAAAHNTITAALQAQEAPR